MSTKVIVRVSDVMKSEFDMVDRLATVADVLRSAKFLDTKCMIVDKRDDDDEYGIVLLSDIAKHILAKDKAPDRVNVYEIMSKPVVSVSPHMDIRYCSRLFENLGLGRAPVVRHGKVIGVVGYTDMVLRGLKDRL